MSVIQAQQPEIRYLKRQNLEQEARIVGNYFRDLIRSYGVDCTYYKLDTSEFENYKGIIDQNTLLKHAYGYDIDPDYSMSAHMLTYMEVQQDIFQLNKFGGNHDADVNFYFDSVDFACALASKAGQYKEYKIKETEIECEVPEYKYHYELSTDNQGKEISVAVPDLKEIVLESGEKISVDVNQGTWPYDLGLGYNENYFCEMLSGKLRARLDGYELDKEQTIVCDPYEHTDFNVKFAANSDLCKSLKRKIEHDDYLETALFLTYKVSKIQVYNDDLDPTRNKYKYILTGKIHGNVLFYDLNGLEKYATMLHPNVGDIVTIDFPDETSREQYEITDCFDKQLTQDGISPLLHKYIWKCQAKRYVNSYEDMESNEANDRLQEKLDYDDHVKREIQKKIEFYPENEDKVYGGYSAEEENLADYDKQDVRNKPHEKYDEIIDGQAMDIVRFGCGSRLCTNGYDLIFVTAVNDWFKVAPCDHEPVVRDAIFESGLRWLKATKDRIVFVNIQGQSTQLATDEQATSEELEICLNNLYDSTIDTGNINKAGDSFVKFKGCRSYLFATPDALYAKLESNKKLYRLI